MLLQTEVIVRDPVVQRNKTYFVFTLQGKSRIRVQISASHSHEDIEQCTNAFIEVGRAKGVIN